MSDTATKVKAIIVDKLGVDEAEVSPEASFTNDLGADSLDIIELIMSVEEKFNLQIPDDKIRRMEKVEDIINYIKQCKK